MKPIKTKLGIHANILAVMLCVSAWASGYTAMLLLGGYVLLFEESETLKKHTIKVFCIMFLTSGAVFAINMIPETLDVISSFLDVLFDGTVYIGFLDTLCSLLMKTIYYLQNLMLLLLGLTALTGKELQIKPLDKLIAAYSNQESSTTDIF